LGAGRSQAFHTRLYTLEASPLFTAPASQVNPKKKLLERLFPDMQTDAGGQGASFIWPALRGRHFAV